MVLSFQTVAEVRFGALDARWGESRLRQLEDRLARTTVVSVTESVTSAYARLKHKLKSQGHGLWNKHHDGDRWIAATAVAYALPLATHDTVFQDVPELELITELHGGS